MLQRLQVPWYNGCMNEIWKPIPYEPFGTKYVVSNLGHIKPIKKSIYSRSKEEFLRPGIGSHPYGHVTLYCNGKAKLVYVHRAVALAFLGEPPAGKNLVCHLDDNTLNNRADNLMWGDNSINMKLMAEHGRSMAGSLNVKAKLNDEKVREIRRLYATGAYSQTSLGEMFGVSQPVISKIVLRLFWKNVL